MWLTDEESRSTVLGIVVVLVLLISLIISQVLRIETLKAEKSKIIAERDANIVELAKVKETMANPKITKDPGVKIEIRERRIDLTKEQAAAIAEKYNIEKSDLQAIITSLCEKITLIQRDGKYESEPIFNNPSRQKRMSVIAEVFDAHQTIGMAYEFIPKWGFSVGISASNGGKLGGNCAVRF